MALDKTMMMERVSNFAAQGRYDEILEKFIMEPLSEKNQIPKDIGIDTPKDKLDSAIKQMLDEKSIFCTNKNYLKDCRFLLIDDAGEGIMSVKDVDDYTVTRCHVPFESERDIDNFVNILLWLDQIDNVMFLNNENLQLNYTVS